MTRPPVFNPMGSDEEEELDARNVAQRRSIEDVPRRRLRVMGVFDDVSQVSLPASTVPASSSAVRDQSVPHSVQDMDEQTGFFSHRDRSACSFWRVAQNAPW